MTLDSHATMHPDSFPAGTLWTRLQRSTSQALACGTLQPIETRVTYCEDQGVTFLVRVVAGLRNKPDADEDHNPFLPYEQELYVADASESHVCVLNKYNVIEHHLLIITRQFEHQESALHARDFHALWRCLSEFDSVGFYNSGTLAGASQRHKHLQLVPARLGASGPSDPCTLRTLLDTATVADGQATQLPWLPLRHAYLRFETRQLTAGPPEEYLTGCYQRSLDTLQISLPRDAQSRVAVPYNLLVTPRWMLVVPRRHECAEGVSLNALAFLGALLVQDDRQHNQLSGLGPWAALQHVGFPRGS